MKILCIAETLQHPSVGGSTRSYHLLKQLALRHRITLLTIDRTSIAPAALSEMSTYLEDVQVAATIPVADTSSFGRERSRQKREAVGRLKQAFQERVAAESYDLVFLHGATAAPVIEDWGELPIVIDIGDANSERLYASLRYSRIRKWPSLWQHCRSVRKAEQQLLKTFPHVTFISCRDRNAFIGKRADAPVVPNGVDLSFWTRRQNHAPANTIAFTGVMDYLPNQDAALHLVDKIIPLIRRSIPDLKLSIVGRNPTAELVQKAKRDGNIVVTGLVDDVRPYLEQAAVFVAPVRFASGTQNKVLEAMAMQIPVVCTATVAAGLHFDDLREPPVCVADRAKPFATAVVELLRDESKRSRLAAQGREFVRQRFDWSRSARLVEALWNEAVKSHPSPLRGTRQAW